MAQRTLHGLQAPENNDVFKDTNNYRELSEIAEQAKKRAEVARYAGFVHTAIKLNSFRVFICT